MVRAEYITFICANCLQPFSVNRSHKDRVIARWHFCSSTCRHAATANPRILAQRFWGMVKMCEHQPFCQSCCWLWNGTITRGGYGAFRFVFPNRSMSLRHASRVAWFFTYGAWPVPFACHDCPNGDNPACVNPAHLFEGDAKANNQDAMAKGRTASGDRNGARLYPEKMSRGVNHYNASITDETVYLIRKLYADGATPIEIVRLVSLPYQQVWKIAKRLSWKHLP